MFLEVEKDLYKKPPFLQLQNIVLSNSSGVDGNIEDSDTRRDK